MQCFWEVEAREAVVINIRYADRRVQTLTASISELERHGMRDIGVTICGINSDYRAYRVYGRGCRTERLLDVASLRDGERIRWRMVCRNFVHAIRCRGIFCSFGNPDHSGERGSSCEADRYARSPPGRDMSWADLPSGLKQPDQKTPCNQAEHEYVDDRYGDPGFRLKEVDIERGNREGKRKDSGIRGRSVAPYRATSNRPVIILVIRPHERPVREQPLGWQYNQVVVSVLQYKARKCFAPADNGPAGHGLWRGPAIRRWYGQRSSVDIKQVVMLLIPAMRIQESGETLDGGGARLQIPHLTAELAVHSSQLTPLKRGHGRRRRPPVNPKQSSAVTLISPCQDCRDPLLISHCHADA